MSFWQNVFLTKRLLTNVVCQRKQNLVLQISHLPWKRSARIFCAKKTWTQPNASWEDFASAHKVWHLGTAAHPFTLSLALLISTTCIQNIFPWSSFFRDKRTFLNLIWPFGQSISMLDYHIASTFQFLYFNYFDKSHKTEIKRAFLFPLERTTLQELPPWRPMQCHCRLRALYSR